MAGTFSGGIDIYLGFRLVSNYLVHIYYLIKSDHLFTKMAGTFTGGYKYAPKELDEYLII